MNKYNAKRTWSSLCKRYFSSKREAVHGEELWLLQMAGEISELTFQVPFILSTKPKITVTIDFRYKEKDGTVIHEDSKGFLTRDSRTKYAWLKAQQNIEVKLS